MIRPLLAALVALWMGTALAGDIPSQWQRDWPKTDFTKILVDPEEIFSGGPPKDGIPAISDPDMIGADTEDTIAPREPVMSIKIEGHPARAYPVRYLMWHEIVNDQIADVPIAVTFCPLCNSGLVFDRRLEGRTLELGVSGLLRFSDMIMYDRQTESWWQQFTGEAIAGELSGSELTALPALLQSWDSFLDKYPDGLVMAEPTLWRRAYGANPYRGYDSGLPFLYRGEDPPHGIRPNARVIRIGARAWPLERLRAEARIEEAGFLLEWSEGQASALSSEVIAEGDEVGNVRVVDAAGNAVVHEVVFAFAFHAFTPEGTWMLGD